MHQGCPNSLFIPYATKIPIIAVSCDGEYDVAMQALRDGVDFYINKEWDLKQLPLTVLTVLEKRKMFKEASESFVRATKSSLGAMSKELNAGLDRTISIAKRTSAKLAKYKEEGRMYG